MNDEWRTELTSEQRVHRASLGVDPGFVNHRKVQSVVGQSGIDEINRRILALPPTMPGYMREVQIDHIYTQVLITFCSAANVKTLGELLADRRGTLFSSIEQVGPCADVFEPDRRVVSTIHKPGFELTAELHYTTTHVRADTTKSELHSGDRLALIAQVHHAEPGRLIFYPLVMGAPWLYADDDVIPSAEWHSFDFFRVFVEDIDEFARVREVVKPEEWGAMKEISERAFKTCMTEILGDEPSKD